MQVKLSELERKYDIQVARHEQLTREMNQLRQLGVCAGGAQARCAGSKTTSLAVTAPGCRTAFQVFVARYSYDPVLYSPNDNPEAELRLSAGDYLFIYGDVDEVSTQTCAAVWSVHHTHDILIITRTARQTERTNPLETRPAATAANLILQAIPAP